uniref:Uncharacterized protein n=1 Tax=Caenorhabditis japonica TaxID=281687 RepID=A0A8R1I7U2_CAEJA
MYVVSPTQKFVLCTMCFVHISYAMFNEMNAKDANNHPYHEKAEYNDFLNMIEAQNEIDKSRIERFVFRGTPKPEDINNYQVDRNGAYYLVCQQQNSKNSSHIENVRCPIRSALYKSGCMASYDYTNKITVQGCYDISTYDFSCQDECVFNVRKHNTMPGSSVKSAVVGFCCCKTSNCNKISEVPMQKAYDAYLSKREEHHHHHHHRDTNQDTANFWDSIRRF